MKTKKINILWLYDDLLDLYGDSGNLMIIKHYLKKNQYQYQIDRKSINDVLKFTGYQMLYIGPGKLKNLIVANEHFRQYKAEFCEAVNHDLLCLIVGNARLMLGNGFTAADQQTYPGIGLFDYEGIDRNEVQISDVIVCRPDNPQQKYYGFINRTAELKPYDNSAPWFKVLSGLADTADTEGSCCHQLYATWLLGPLLVKNPALLQEFMKKLTGNDQLLIDNELEQKAYELTIKEFK